MLRLYLRAQHLGPHTIDLQRERNAGEKEKEKTSKGCDRIFNLKGQDMGSISQTNVGTASKGDGVKKISEGKSGVTFRLRLHLVLNQTV